MYPEDSPEKKSRKHIPLNYADEEEKVSENLTPAYKLAYNGQPFYKKKLSDIENQLFSGTDYDVLPPELRNLTSQYMQTYENLQEPCRHKTHEWKDCAAIFEQGMTNEHNLIDPCALDCFLNNLPTHFQNPIIRKDLPGFLQPANFNILVQDNKEGPLFQLFFRYNEATKKHDVKLMPFPGEKRVISLDDAKDLLVYYANVAEIVIEPVLNSYGYTTDDIRYVPGFGSIRGNNMRFSKRKTDKNQPVIWAHY